MLWPRIQDRWGEEDYPSCYGGAKSEYTYSCRNRARNQMLHENPTNNPIWMMIRRMNKKYTREESVHDDGSDDRNGSRISQPFAMLF